MSEEFLQSGEVLLEIAKSEYQNEFNRSSVLDTKIGIALPIIATYFFLILQYKSVRQLFITNPDCTNIMTLILSVCIPIIFVAAIISAAIALIYLFRAIVTHSYQTIDPCYFNDKDKMSLSPSVFSGVMVVILDLALHNVVIHLEQKKFTLAFVQSMRGRELIVPIIHLTIVKNKQAPLPLDR